MGTDASATGGLGGITVTLKSVTNNKRENMTTIEKITRLEGLLANSEVESKRLELELEIL